MSSELGLFNLSQLIHTSFQLFHTLHSNSVVLTLFVSWYITCHLSEFQLISLSEFHTNSGSTSWKSFIIFSSHAAICFSISVNTNHTLFEGFCNLVFWHNIMMTIIAMIHDIEKNSAFFFCCLVIFSGFLRSKLMESGLFYLSIFW